MEITLVSDLCVYSVVTQNQEPIRPAVPVLIFAGDRPALFPPLFFAHSLFKPSESSGINQYPFDSKCVPKESPRVSSYQRYMS